MTARDSDERLSSGALARLRQSMHVHMDHYGGGRLAFASLSAHGVRQRMVALDGPECGVPFDVIDVSGAYGTACLGAGHDVVRQALDHAMTLGVSVTDEIASAERATLFEQLFAPDGPFGIGYDMATYHVSGRNSGSEGIELALRLALERDVDRRSLRPVGARQRRRTILAFQGAWHGWTGAANTLTNRRYFRLGLPSYGADAEGGFTTAYLPFGLPDALESFFASEAETLAAVVVEPVQGDAGIIVPPPGYLRRLAQLCREHDVLLIADEVLTFAKTGRWLALADDDGAIPADICVVGKSLGLGAVSTSLVVARRSLMVRASGTVSTSDLRPLIALLIQRGIAYIARERLLDRSRMLGAQLRALLASQLVAAFPDVYSAVRGMGFLNGVELTERAAGQVRELRTDLLRAGVYVECMSGAGRRSHGLPFGFPVVRIAPPLIATVDDLTEAVRRLAIGTDAFASRVLYATR